MRLNPHLRPRKSSSSQQGYVLIVVLLFFVLLAIGMTAAAPAMVHRIRRDREGELIHRGRQYTRAIRLYYRKFGRYPVKIEDLESTNNLRFLRKRYKDPMTPGGEWRLIRYGQAQLTPTTANPLLPGATAPGANPGGVGAGVGGAGSSSAFANTFSAGSSTTAQNNATSATGTTTSGSGTTGSSSENSQSSQSGGQPGQPGTPASSISSPLGGGQQFGGGPIVGVASTSKKESIRVINQKNHYNDWEFVYDPTFDVNPAAALPQTAGSANPPNATPAGIQISPGFNSPASPGMQQPGGTR